MSGPKVVRVVTREERVATCLTLLAQLDRELGAWSAEVSAAGVDGALSAATAKRAEFASLLASDKFDDLQRLIPAELVFLRSDAERRREEVLTRRVAKLQQERLQRKNAVTLLAELRSKGMEIEPGLAESLDQVAAGRVSGNTAETLLGEAFRLLAQPRVDVGASLTEEQKALATRLAPQEGVAFDDWKKLRAAVRDPRIESVERRLAELSTYLGDVETEAFTKRLLAIETEPEGYEANLRTDGLVLDLASAVKTAKERRSLLVRAEEALADLEILRPSQSTGEVGATAATQSLRSACERQDIAALPDLILRAKEALASVVAHRAAQSKRSAILAGLSELGYEVHEGMSTAWAEKGRVVLRKPSLPDYGVEIASAGNAERLQVRAVALTENRDLARDRDVETSWCGDFGKLRGLLASQGGAIEIERALAIGEVPLKEVLSSPQQSDESGQSIQTRRS